MVRLWPLLFVCAVPRPAQAWNEPQVSAVSARLNATELRRTQVTLDVSVRVSEAWL
jgi:hypothetical protein